MFYDLFAMDASTDGLGVAQGHCCYMYQTCCGGSSQNINDLCYICDFSDARRKIPGVTTTFQ